MARWHVEEEKESTERRAARMRDAQKAERRVGDAGGGREAADDVEDSKKDTANRVGRSKAC